MFTGNYKGFHTKLTPEVHAKIIAMAPRGLTLRVISKLCGLSHDTLIEWLKRAKTENEQGMRTPFTHLSLEFEEKIGNEIVSLINDVRKRKKNWQAAWELLRSINREDFGVDASQFQHLVEIIDKLKQDIALLKLGQGKGLNHEKEMDSSCDKE